MDVRQLSPKQWSGLRSLSHGRGTFPDSLKGLAYSILSRACRGWPCGGGWEVTVRRTPDGYLPGGILVTWVERSRRLTSA